MNNSNQNNRQPGIYGHVPPPQSLQQSSRGYRSGGYSSDRQKESRNHAGAYQSGGYQSQQNNYAAPGPWSGGYMSNNYQQQSGHQSYQQQRGGFSQQQQRVVRPYSNQPGRSYNQQVSIVLYINQCLFE